MANDGEWKKRTDDWIKMQEQSAALKKKLKQESRKRKKKLVTE